MLLDNINFWSRFLSEEFPYKKSSLRGSKRLYHHIPDVRKWTAIHYRSNYFSHICDYIFSLTVLQERIDFLLILREKCERMTIENEKKYGHPQRFDYIVLLESLEVVAKNWERRTVLLHLQSWRQDLLDIESGVQELNLLCEEFHRLLLEGGTVVELEESIAKQNECAERRGITKNDAFYNSHWYARSHNVSMRRTVGRSSSPYYRDYYVSLIKCALLESHYHQLEWLLSELVQHTPAMLTEALECAACLDTIDGLMLLLEYMIRHYDGMVEVTREIVNFSAAKCGKDVINFAIRKAIIASIGYKYAIDSEKDYCKAESFKYLVSIAVSRGIDLNSFIPTPAYRSSIEEVEKVAGVSIVIYAIDCLVRCSSPERWAIVNSSLIIQNGST